MQTTASRVAQEAGMLLYLEISNSGLRHISLGIFPVSEFCLCAAYTPETS